VNGWLILLALAVLAATAYLTSLQFHPWTSCKGCSRSGKTRDPVFRSTSGTCRASAAWPRARARCPRRAARRARRMTAAPATHKITGEPKS
jgi:hypothetical protein